MIDLHTHVIPAVDDGAATLEETCSMLALAAEDGIAEIVATPHCDLRYKFDPEHCRSELDRIRAACPTGPRLYLGCELHLTPENIGLVLKSPSRFTLNGGDCLLIELPDRIVAAGLEAGLDAFLGAGLRPVIAHPERNLFLQRNPSYASHLVESGCYLQITSQSLGGSFGAPAKHLAGALLKQCLVHFVASDCHGAQHRRPSLSPGYSEVVHSFGEPAAELLFVRNPRAALRSEPLESMSPTGRRPLLSVIFGTAFASCRSRGAAWEAPARTKRIAGRPQALGEVTVKH